MSHYMTNGIGFFVPGQYPVPQNPVKDGALRTGVVAKSADGIGFLVPGSFPVPQNPISGTPRCDLGLGRVAFSGSSMASLSSSRGCGMGGLGSLGMFESWNPANWGTTEWLVAGGLALFLFSALSPGGSNYRSKKADLRKQYKRQLKDLRSRSRGYKRAAAMVAA